MRSKQTFIYMIYKLYVHFNALYEGINWCQNSLSIYNIFYIKKNVQFLSIKHIVFFQVAIVIFFKQFKTFELVNYAKTSEHKFLCKPSNVCTFTVNHTH